LFKEKQRHYTHETLLFSLHYIKYLFSKIEEKKTSYYIYLFPMVFQHIHEEISARKQTNFVDDNRE